MRRIPSEFTLDPKPLVKPVEGQIDREDQWPDLIGDFWPCVMSAVVN